MAIAVFSFISSPNLKEPSFLSFTEMSGTFLEAANAGRCFVNHRGWQSDANNIAYFHMKKKLISINLNCKDRNDDIRKIVSKF